MTEDNLSNGRERPLSEFLHPLHVEDLHKSGLREDSVRKMHIRAVLPDAIKANGVVTAYSIPYWGLDGKPADFERQRLFPPLKTRDGHTQKYAQPAGTAPQLYLPPFHNWQEIAASASDLVRFTEGEKKAAKATQEGFRAIGIGGVWNWVQRLENGQRLVLPTFDQFVWKGRRVEIVPDSDVWREEKLQAFQAIYFLGMELVQRGALVGLVRLPERSAVKVGLDDWLVNEWANGKQGWEHLEILSLDDQRLKKHAASWQKWQRRQERAGQTAGSSQSARVNCIRLDTGMRPFERKREIADLVIEDLRSRGRLLRAPDNELLFFGREQRQLLGIIDPEFTSALYDRFGLNPTEEETRFMEKEVMTAAMQHGERVNLYSLSHWDEENQRLYVSLNDGTMMRLDGCSMSQVDNGTDGVLFRTDPDAQRITPNFSAGEESFHAAFDGLSLQGDEEERRNALTLLKIFLICILFPERLRVKPILVLAGEQGSGKTSLARRLGLVLCGPSFEVASFRSDAGGELDFLAAISGRRLLAFDNADTRIPWLPDHLARLATGSSLPRRQLYTTNSLVSYRPMCFLMLTSRDPKWNRDDVASRLLPIRMGTIAGKAAEGALQRSLVERLPQIWGGLLTIVSRTVSAIRNSNGAFTSSHRLADFDCFGHAAAMALKCDETFHAAMERLDASQQELLAQGDQRLSLIAEWLDEELRATSEVCINVKRLFDMLESSYTGLKGTFPFKSSHALGTWVGRSKSLIESHSKVIVSKPPSEHDRGWIFRKHFRE